MGHRLGILETDPAALPDVVVALFAVITQLGDTWLLFLLVVSVYLVGDQVPILGHGVGRRGAAFLLALGLGAAALTIGLKALFAHPRPTGYATATAPAFAPDVLATLYVRAATADGYSFPSGHALGSTVVWGGIALASRRGTRERRLLAAAAIVLLVAASRVVLGVHFVGDVAAGLAAGLAFLGVMYAVARDAPGRALLLAVVVALGAVAVAGFHFDAIAVLGATVGARVAWGAVGDGVPDHHVDEEALFLAAVGIPLVVVLFGATYALEFLLDGEYLPLVGGFLGAGLTLGVVVALPVVAREYLVEA